MKYSMLRAAMVLVLAAILLLGVSALLWQRLLLLPTATAG